MVVSQAAPWFREACAIVDHVGLGYVLPCDWRTCRVVLGPRCVRFLFKFAFECVIPLRAFVSRRGLRCVFVAFCQLLSWSSGAAI